MPTFKFNERFPINSPFREELLSGAKLPYTVIERTDWWWPTNPEASYYNSHDTVAEAREHIKVARRLRPSSVFAIVDRRTGEVVQ